MCCHVVGWANKFPFAWLLSKVPQSCRLTFADEKWLRLLVLCGWQVIRVEYLIIHSCGFDTSHYNYYHIIALWYLAICEKRCKIPTQLLWNANRYSYVLYWMVLFPMRPWVTPTTPNHPIFDRLYRLSNLRRMWR